MPMLLLAMKVLSRYE